MVRERLLLNNSSKIILPVLDGSGDIPYPAFSCTTPLEAARKPNINRLSIERGVTGLGTIRSNELTSLALACGLRLDKYGA